MPKYLIHEHHASHLHWDLRLEHNKVLKSWAVPKTPPKSKGVKRLAVQVPDHKLSYASFEGTIEEGNYGAGEVKIWDSGTFDTIEKTNTKWIINIKGNKLKGQYCLIKFDKAGPKNWLFFKK